MHGPFIHLCRNGHSSCLLIVQAEMLNGGSHILALHTFDMCGGNFTCCVRILRIILKVTSAERGSLNIHCRSKDHAYVFCLTFLSKGLSYTVKKLPVKGGCHGTACRKADSLDTVIYTKMISLQILLSQSVRSIGHHHIRNLQSLYCFGMPEIRSGTDPCFFFQRHF